MSTVPPTPPFPAALRFGPSGRYELQPAERRLLVDGRPANLGHRALDLLIALAERPDHLLTKAELLDRVWPGLVVEEANLQMQVSNLRKVLGSEAIATVPGRGYRFAATLTPPAPAHPVALAAAAALPPTAPRHGEARLIGRGDDLVGLEALLAGGGCVTLIGPPGVGKTRLARAAAARWTAGRTVWVDLAALAHGRQVTGAVARALGLHVDAGDAELAAHLVDALRDQALLLVLDNAEHLLQACAELVLALQALAGVRILVTSQAAFAIGCERVWRLDPLRLPEPEETPDDAAAEGALALLVERLREADRRFVVTPAALPCLRAICTQLDGLPLALEMAAARVPLLGLQGVHDALVERYALLTRGQRDAPTRHRTLRHALDWSYRLLEPDEQRLFRALGVCADGFSLDLAATLMTDDPAARWAIVDGLAALADRSLLVVGAEEPPRYRLLETMRAYALEQLATDAEEAITFRRRHATAVLGLLSRYAPGSDASKAQCLAEMENAREAMAWARERAGELGLAAQLSAKVVFVTTFSLWRHESGNWLLGLEPLMDGPDGAALPPEVQAQWWTERARIGSIRRDAGARVHARRAVALWQPLRQPHASLRATLIWVRSSAVADPELAQACRELEACAAAIPDLPARERLGVLGALARAAMLRVDYGVALATREAEVALARQLGDQDAAEAAESSIVGILSNLGRHAEAVARGGALLEQVDADGSGRNGNLPWILGTLFSALLALDRVAEARALLPRVCAVGRRFAQPSVALELVAIAAAERRHAAAAQLLGYAYRTYESHAIDFEPPEAAGVARIRAAVDAALGVPQAQALITRGRGLTDAAADALAAAD